MKNCDFIWNKNKKKTKKLLRFNKSSKKWPKKKKKKQRQLENNIWTYRLLDNILCTKNCIVCIAKKKCKILYYSNSSYNYVTLNRWLWINLFSITRLDGTRHFSLRRKLSIKIVIQKLVVMISVAWHVFYFKIYRLIIWKIVFIFLILSILRVLIDTLRFSKTKYNTLNWFFGYFTVYSDFTTIKMVYGVFMIIFYQ